MRTRTLALAGLVALAAVVAVPRPNTTPPPERHDVVKVQATVPATVVVAAVPSVLRAADTSGLPTTSVDHAYLIAEYTSTSLGLTPRAATVTRRMRAWTTAIGVNDPPNRLRLRYRT